MHSGIWERLADALFWLQLCWVVAGFALMIYLATKVMPHSKEPNNSRIGSYDGNRRELIVLGGYRFEVTQDASGSRPNVIELCPDRLDRRRHIR